MVQQLLDWKNFNKAEDPERARQLVEQLRAATEVQTERRNVDLAAVQRRRAQYQAQIDEKQSYGEELVQLQRLFLEMIGWQDRSKRGIEFQKLLHRLFVISGLSPKAPFRIVGEEIDGAFVLDYDHFLLEARWRAEKTSEADLLVLRGKVEGKFDGTRGLFISVNNYTDGAITSITQGKRPNVILMGGEHLNHVLDGRMRFDDLLRELLRVASATGDVWVPLSVLAGYR